MIDWELAISTGVRFARQGPSVSLADARAVVAELRALTAVVQQPVRDVTGLVSQGAVGPVAVVDRPGWIRANVGGFRVVLEPLADRLAELRDLGVKLVPMKLRRVVEVVVSCALSMISCSFELHCWRRIRHTALT